MNYAEFCTGVGGFRLGIDMSGINLKSVYANEIDDSCEKTYKRNFGTSFDSKDLFQVNPHSIPDIDMLCAGFPCQPFSVAGKELGFNDARGTIFFQLVEILKCKKPGVVFLENVPNLKRHDKGRTFKVIISKLEEIGYRVFSAVLDSTYFGVPQSRSRVYIVGILEEKYGKKDIKFTDKKTEKTPLRPFLIPGDNSIPVTARWNEYIDYYLGLKTEDQMSFEVPRTRKQLERIASTCDLTDCVFQVRSSGVRALSLDNPLPTLTVLNSGGGAHIPVMSRERRHLSIGEMRRVMGFPDDYSFDAVSRTDAAKQLANAVCPPVIASIIKDIAETLGW